ncbi:hypothetical protein D3C73_565790 [compost metagenome]
MRHFQMTSKKINEKSSIVTKVRAAILAHVSSSPLLPISVSAICLNAGVNRANLYSHHKDLVHEILSIGVARRTDKSYRENKKDMLCIIQERDEISSRYNALLIVCLELQAEIKMLRAELATRHIR